MINSDEISKDGIIQDELSQDELSQKVSNIKDMFNINNSMSEGIIKLAKKCLRFEIEYMDIGDSGKELDPDKKEIQDLHKLYTEKQVILEALLKWLKLKKKENLYLKLKKLEKQIGCYHTLLEKVQTYRDTRLSCVELQHNLASKSTSEYTSGELLQLGICSLLGDGIPQNDAFAIECFKHAADKKHPFAQLCMAEVYALDEIFTIDLKSESENELKTKLENNPANDLAQRKRLANQYYELAATEKMTEAQVALAFHYLNGEDGIECDPKKAFNWFLTAANLDNPRAQYEVSQLYLFGRGVDKDNCQATQWNAKAAAKGIPEAQVMLAMTFFNIKDLESDKLGMEWLNRAVLKNNSIALHVLGKIYENGNLEVKKDKDQSLRYYEQAAELGSKAAKKRLFSDYLIDRNPKKRAMAMKWLIELAIDKNAEALYLLGEMFEELNHHKISRRYTAEMISLYEQSALQNCVKAQIKLGSHYLRGYMIEKDLPKSIHWFTKAAALGEKRAQGFLGGLYLNGIGVERNNAKAYYWFLKSAQQNNGINENSNSQKQGRSKTRSKQ